MFRPQGRDPRIGVDCIGLIAWTFSIASEAHGRDYRLRGDHGLRLRAALNRHFRVVPRAKARSGDVLLLKVATDQLHLAVLADRSFIHADAGLRRVVETPGAVPWPILAVFRRRTRRQPES
jgi:hypothetical protein